MAEHCEEQGTNRPCLFSQNSCEGIGPTLEIGRACSVSLYNFVKQAALLHQASKHSGNSLDTYSEVLGSYLGRDTGIPERCFRDFPQSIHVSAGIVSRLGHNHFLPNLFIILSFNAIITKCHIMTYKKLSYFKAPSLNSLLAKLRIAQIVSSFLNRWLH